MLNRMTLVRNRRYSGFEVNFICSLLWLYFAGSLAAMFWNWTNGATTLVLANTNIQGYPFSFSFRIDSLSTLMLTMITLLGALISQYSIRYLSGDQGKNYFFRYLFLVLTSTSLLVTSGNLIMFFFAWLGASLSLHKLLIYYGNRPQAIRAARKKFIISRLGDLALLLAIGLTFHLFNTFDFQELFEKVSFIVGESKESRAIELIGFLFALGAMTKSAQLPFHFWLPETMEAPTPVSALMHAGIINAGGFLIIRLSPILEHANTAHLLLAVVGSATAVFAALVMITQNHLKSKLAYSTISQMGMMLFACGLGAYSLAVFHIIAHSFYKAYAFLSTGMQVEESKKSVFPQGRPSKKFLGIMTVVGLGLLITGLIYQGGYYLEYAVYCAIIFLGIVQNLGTFSTPARKTILTSRIGLILATSITAFFLIEYSLNLYLSPLVPSHHSIQNLHSIKFLLCICSYIIFVFGFWLSAYLPQAQGPIMRKAYCYFWNGGYFSAYSSTLLERIFGSVKIKTQESTQISVKEPANA